LLPLSLGYAVSRCFNTYYFAVISNAGDLCMLIALTVLTYRLQLDLAVAGSFADFLHRSNVVFRSSHAVSSPSPSHSSATRPKQQAGGADKQQVGGADKRDDVLAGARASLDTHDEEEAGAGVAMTAAGPPSEEQMVRADDVEVSLE
jgi:hypothetical protein